MAIARKTVLVALESVLGADPFRSAAFFLESKAGITVVRATRRHKPSKRDRTTEVVVTIGAPNYAEREHIRRCRRRGWSVKRSPRLCDFPAKKGARK